MGVKLVSEKERNRCGQAEKENARGKEKEGGRVGERQGGREREILFEFGILINLHCFS